MNVCKVTTINILRYLACVLIRQNRNSEKAFACVVGSGNGRFLLPPQRLTYLKNFTVNQGIKSHSTDLFEEKNTFSVNWSTK